ncbi:MAG: hypothetical protein II595_04520 [Desulfovibrio sp.]|nr:hypothetical protein [Desulfovibrio sp.]
MAEQDWQAVKGELANETGLVLMLDRHEQCEEEEFVTHWIVYGRDIRLGRGASCFLPRHLRHRVAATSSPCVWLCLFGEGLALNCASCPGLVPLPAGLAEAGAAEDLGTLAEQTELC